MGKVDPNRMIQIAAADSEKQLPRQFRRVRMDLTQAMLMNRSNSTIGKIPMNQTNGSPAME
jgi:hypothetical protein